MNLWVKRTAQLLSIAVALFFLSCQDDVIFLGYRNPNEKFDVHYVEIPLESSVFLTDSVRTAVVSGELARLLVGHNNDMTSAFGEVKTLGISQFLPINNFTNLNADTVSGFRFDSVALELRYDYYAYGAKGSSKQTISVHQLEETVNPANIRKYYSVTPTAYLDESLGSNSISVDLDHFKEQYKLADAQKDTTVLHISLDSTWGASLMTFAKTQSTDFTNAEKFSALYKGLALIPGTDPTGSNNNKVLGIDVMNSLDPGSMLTRLVVYYHRDGFVKARTLNFGFYGIEYTKIEGAPSGDLAALLNKYDEVTPLEKRYIQQGTRIITKVDMGEFYKFADEDSVKGMIINSCELTITGIDNFDVFEPVPTLALVAMNDFEPNHYHKARYRIVYDTNINGDTINVRPVLADSLVAGLNLYQGYINDVGGLFTGIADGQNSAVTLSWNGQSYITYMTMLAQTMAGVTPSERYQHFALLPSPPSNPQKEKSVNRISFNKENLKLKIFYTIPKQQAEQ